MNLDSRLHIYLGGGVAVCRRKKAMPPPTIGYLRQTPYGNVWVVDWEFPRGHRHGNTQLVKPKAAHPLLDHRVPKLDLAKATIIDTETTGLAGGTGTYAFIIGIGFWRNDRFVVRQYVMRDFNEEPAQLEAFAGDFAGAMVSFNGKCFDIPLLANRFRLHRRRVVFENALHLDMLATSRRIWKRHLRDFSLAALEQQVLGFARVDDVPAHLIPGIFFDYLQSQDETLLHPVLHHNRNDIVSLHQLVKTASDVAENFLKGAGNDDDLFLSLAEVCFAAGEYEKACYLAGRVDPRFATISTACQALRLIASSQKKLGNWDGALCAYERYLELQPDPLVFVESAKLLEHKKRDPKSALGQVDKAWRLLESFPVAFDHQRKQFFAELAHRRQRLLLKIGRKFGR